MLNLALCLLAAWSISFAGSTPLDDYVNAPDESYGYEDLGDPYRGKGYSSYFINLTSQTWLTRELRKLTVQERVFEEMHLIKHNYDLKILEFF